MASKPGTLSGDENAVTGCWQEMYTRNLRQLRNDMIIGIIVYETDL